MEQHRLFLLSYFIVLFYPLPLVQLHQSAFLTHMYIESRQSDLTNPAQFYEYTLLSLRRLFANPARSVHEYTHNSTVVVLSGSFDALITLYQPSSSHELFMNTYTVVACTEAYYQMEMIKQMFQGTLYCIFAASAWVWLVFVKGGLLKMIGWFTENGKRCWTEKNVAFLKMISQAKGYHLSNAQLLLIVKLAGGCSQSFTEG